MRLLKVRIRGFQSFSDSGDMEFLSGINLIVGQNNAGKSALLRALLPTLPDDRHRMPEKWEAFRLQVPAVDLTIEVNGAEIREWILRSGSQKFIPIPEKEDPAIFIQSLFDYTSLPLSVSRIAGGSFSAPYPSHGLFPWPSGTQQAAAMVQPNNGELSIGKIGSNFDFLPSLLSHAWEREMFYFAAERMTIGESPSGYADRLLPNAGNLPNVLHTLSSERGDVFRQLVHHLRDIFATVGNVSVRTKPASPNFEVRIWPTEAMERVELSFPLNSSGTGVAQVIALLTAIMTLDQNIFIMDEINSFLHPAAVKSLLRILLTQYHHHQYIISTHAPDVIGFSNPSTIHLVKRKGYESAVERLDTANVTRFREIAEHLGVSMADVFAAERVIWVEGPTEELCFPFIYQKLVAPLPRGTIITSVVATGDFNSHKRDPALVYDVYTRLSTGAATLTVSVIFSFDSEKLSDSDKADMMRRSGGRLRFLPRRHLECFLIDPNAISDFIMSRDSASAEAVTPVSVKAALESTAGEHPFAIREWSGDITNPDWLARVDAANLIGSVCATLSEQRVRFEKKNDSLFLLRHIVEHNPEQLMPLKDYVASLVSAVLQPNSGYAEAD